MAEQNTVPVGTTENPATPVKAPAFTIESTLSRQRYLKLLVYGDYGVGKTTLAGSSAEVPSMEDILLLDAEAGDLSLNQYDNIDVIRVSSYKQIGQVEQFLKQHCLARENNDKARLIEMEATLKGVDPSTITTPKKYNTVLVDSLTEVEAFCMNQLLGITLTTRIDEETAVAEWPEFRRNFQMIQRFVRTFRDLPMNVVMVCSSSYVQDEHKRFNYAPSMTGKLSGAIQGFFDMVGFYVIVKSDDGKPMRRLFVQPIDKFAAKNRFANFKSAWFDNPTMESILQGVNLLPK